MKLVFSTNVAWSIFVFRKNLLLTLKKNGYEIYVVGKTDKYVKDIEEFGFKFVPVAIDNNSKNPIKDLLLIFQYIKIYNKIKPNIILHNAIKPNIYGTIAAGFLKIPSINNISGLGTLFIRKSFTTKLAIILYRFSQKFATKIFFQNNDDKQFFIDNKIVTPNKSVLIPGSGVDVDKFHPSLNAVNSIYFDFMFVGRLIKDKGIYEFIEAAKMMLEKYKDVTFSIVGAPYIANSTSITNIELNSWIDNKIINYYGETDHVENYMSKTNCIVLPSYREGLSKVLIEACSLAKPIITTNVPGCKDVVVDNVNGFLCKDRNAFDLFEKMEKMKLLKENEIQELSKNSRKIAIEKFDERIVIEIYEKEVSKILNLSIHE